MLTIAKVTDSAAAANYYEGEEDYYGVKGNAHSTWGGVGSGYLGLAGRVEAWQFKELLDGKLPDGSHIHNAAEGRRAGTDLTFSAPKSVSMQALIGGDRRIIDAHDVAVSRALAYAEKHLAAYRLTTNGETQRLPSGNLLVAKFRHELSRDCDPQIHTHAVAVNATQNALGGWRALDVSDFYINQKLLGALYRSELAQELQHLGYKVRQTSHDGLFELTHISDRQVASFSQRSLAIDKLLHERGTNRQHASAREREFAGLATRKHKTDVDRQVLLEAWREKSLQLGIDYAPMQLSSLTSAEQYKETHLAVDYAIEHTTERQSIVNHSELVKHAIMRSIGSATLAQIELELTKRVVTGELLQVDNRYTTMLAQERERTMLSIEDRSRRLVSSIDQPQDVLYKLNAVNLNSGQRASAEAILTTHNQVIGVQGLAGSGKTYMLAEVRKIAEEKGWRLLGLAPSAAAATELGKSKITSKTIASFLTMTGPRLDGRSLLVVDEAGMVPATDMLSILSAAEKVGAHVVLVGDTQQLKAVQAGKPFAQLQQAGMQTVVMSEVLRQTNLTLKSAVEFAAHGNVQESLKLLKQQIVEIDYAGPRHLQIALDYIALSAIDRDKTLIVAGTNFARKSINENVRQGLGFEGKGIQVEILERRDLTQAQLKSSLSYHQGDVVEMLSKYESLGLARGARAIVIAAEAGKVTLQRGDGQQVVLRPALMNKTAVYEIGERELSMGDSVRFTANNYSLGYINGESGRVVDIDIKHEMVTIQKNSGEYVTLDSLKPMQLDHGYCSTVHSAQGQTSERVLIEADAKSTVSNESLYYVAISRARSEVKIYTDDKDMLPEAMGRADEKTAALDLSDRIRTKKESLVMA